jgi:hypothetical protein
MRKGLFGVTIKLMVAELMGAWLILEGMKLVTQSFYLVCYYHYRWKKSFFFKVLLQCGQESWILFLL